MKTLFDDVTLIREGGWLKRLGPFDALPDDYGVAWQAPNCAYVVAAPMPFHAILGWAYRLYWAWRVTNGCDDTLSRCYRDGVRDAERTMLEKAAFRQAQHDAELRRAEQRGYSTGYRRALEDARRAIAMTDTEFTDWLAAEGQTKY